MAFSCSASPDPIEQVNLEIATRIRHRDKPGRPMQKRKSKQGKKKKKKKKIILLSLNSGRWFSVGVLDELGLLFGSRKLVGAGIL